MTDFFAHNSLMFRKFTDRITSAASSVLGSETDNKVQSLVAMGFSITAAQSALAATDGHVDRAAELLLAQGNAMPTPPAADPVESEDAVMRRVMQESLQIEQQRVARQPQRTAAVHKAGQAAVLRSKGRPQTIAPKPLSEHHPDVKLIPRLQDKSKEEQILRCADRLKNSPSAVDTLHRALTMIQQNPTNDKYRKVDKSTTGYQRSLATAPGAEDLLTAMNFHNRGTTLVLERSRIDPALLYLGISALEQTKQTPEYIAAKQKLVFAKEIRDIQASADSSADEAIQRSSHMSKCPSEPAEGRGALLHVIMADETVRRRFDADDTLADVLHWLGGHGSVIYDKLLSREWSLLCVNQHPIVPLDCQKLQHRTLQYIGCWPSGRLELVPSTEEWRNGGKVGTMRSSSRGLGAAPSDVVH